MDPTEKPAHQSSTQPHQEEQHEQQETPLSPTSSSGFSIAAENETTETLSSQLESLMQSVSSKAEELRSALHDAQLTLETWKTWMQVAGKDEMARGESKVVNILVGAVEKLRIKTDDTTTAFKEQIMTWMELNEEVEIGIEESANAGEQGLPSKEPLPVTDAAVQEKKEIVKALKDLELQVECGKEGFRDQSGLIGLVIQTMELLRQSNRNKG